ncbi:sigma-54 dependent transcriptional regulator [Simiduia curdlanivorans]|uniref:Sigma-54-dependent transcriptional regulator n=1 Tax=Simiduia curdlanivorans TaxID=1492769 RepID=A0ABV8V9C4_9GAMM|nr:sigma-54 dependent transcriptional regulator [Simiduia curdlanivorans]MDN3639852.1 sigma-54 dependent transcriptional regulator [Simiduia curdlanivorans]
MTAQAVNERPAKLSAETVLIVEDDASLRDAMEDTLSFAGISTASVACAEAAISYLSDGNEVAMIVSDINMGKLSGHDLLRHVRQYHPQVPVLLVTAYGSIVDSVEAMREGAVDYLVKPFESQDLVQLVHKHAINQGIVYDAPVAESAQSKQLLQLADRVAQSDSTVLILGESGTGKEVLARYIHARSARRDQPFVAINCAAIPENMLEAVLFGHEKGAYTGAHASAPGKFEQANGGTLLLDEISEMALGLQAKLLRVLQEREVERLGGRKLIKLDVRVMATSNRGMREEVLNGRFREDLYYRLSVLPMQWQPLRARKDDIRPLAESLMRRHAQKQGRKGVVLSPAAIQTLENYPWPGNVRELDNVMQRALILQPSSRIEPLDLGLEFGLGQTPADQSLFVPSAAAAVRQQETPEPNVSDGLLGDDLKKREFEVIVDTLRKVHGSRKDTAARLGISARTLRYKVARLKDDGFDVDGAWKMAH